MQNALTETGKENIVSMNTGSVILEGKLYLPENARGVVIFTHSSDNRHSPGNKYLAQRLNNSGIGTLSLNLLTPEEGEIDENKMEFSLNIGLLTERLVAIADWLKYNLGLKDIKTGIFGAGTGAAAALAAAALRPELVKVVVSRGGRPDLAGKYLEIVKAPTLLMLGSLDYSVIPLNQNAMDYLTCKKYLMIIPGAKHLFEETGKLEKVADLAQEWFNFYFV
jgi:putative phosphoribosyl transferase